MGEHGSARLETGFLLLAKIGGVAVRWRCPLEGTPKTVTISRAADGWCWYVCISCAEVPVQPVPLTGQETGIDVGLESFATLADGTMMHPPRCFRKAERRLKTAQRTVARRKKGSTRRKKAVQLLAKAHLTVKRQRLDFQNKTALTLVQDNDTIYHDELQVANMLKNHHLAKSIQDADGTPSGASLLSRQHGPGAELSPCLLPPPARRVLAGGGSRHEGLVGPLARLPGMRDKPAS